MTHKENYRRYRETEKGRRTCKNVQLRNKFGITIEEYESILKIQRYMCALCREPLSLHKYRDTCVDHCHRTSKIRGIIHRKCNLRLQALDDYLWMKYAIEYLGGEVWKYGM
jgi:hypothetical protein